MYARRFWKASTGRPATALGRRIGRDQVRVFPLQRLELTHERVEFRVSDLGIVTDVVLFFVVTDSPAEVFDPFPTRHWRAGVEVSEGWERGSPGVNSRGGLLNLFTTKLTRRFRDCGSRVTRSVFRPRRRAPRIVSVVRFVVMNGR